MESVTIQLKVHCEVALAIKGIEKLVEALDFSKNEKISDGEQVWVLHWRCCSIILTGFNSAPPPPPQKRNENGFLESVASQLEVTS